MLPDAAVVPGSSEDHRADRRRIDTGAGPTCRRHGAPLAGNFRRARALTVSLGDLGSPTWSRNPTAMARSSILASSPSFPVSTSQDHRGQQEAPVDQDQLLRSVPEGYVGDQQGQ